MTSFFGTIITSLITILGSIFVFIMQLQIEDSKKIFLIDYWYIIVLIILFGIIIDIVRVFLDKDKSDSLRSKIFYILYYIDRSRNTEKKYIINDLNSKINLARRKLEYSNKILPKLVDIQWIDEPNEHGNVYDLKDGEFVVKLYDKKSQDENIISLVKAVTHRTSLTGIRYILDNNRPLEESIDEVVTESLIVAINNKNIIDKYYINYLSSRLQSDDKIKEYFEQLKSIDNLGMFYRIFLVELEFFSNRIIGQPYKPFLLGEIEHFLEYLIEIQPEKTPDKVELSYEKAFLRTGILLIRSNKIINEGLDGYIKMVDCYIKYKYNSFYLVYFEKENTTIYWRRFNERIDQLIKIIRSKITLDMEFDEHYNVFVNNSEKRKARCIRYVNSESV